MAITQTETCSFRLQPSMLQIFLQACFDNLVLHIVGQIYFWNETLHVSDSSSVHHLKFFTVHTVMVYVIEVCCLYSDKLLMMGRGTVRNM